jgi:hypothetical protein
MDMVSTETLVQAYLANFYLVLARSMLIQAKEFLGRRWSQVSALSANSLGIQRYHGLVT